MELDFSKIESLEAAIDKPLGHSLWYDIDQNRITAFGELTLDFQAIHMDPEWAKDHSPFGKTIAHGFLCLSLLPAMMGDIFPRDTSQTYKLNYGFDRVRFI